MIGGVENTVAAARKSRDIHRKQSAFNRAEHGSPLLKRKNGTLGEILFTVPLVDLIKEFGPERNDEVESFKKALSLLLIGRRIDQGKNWDFQRWVLAHFKLATAHNYFREKFPDYAQVQRKFEEVVLGISSWDIELSPEIKEEIEQAFVALNEKRHIPISQEISSASFKSLLLILLLFSLEAYVQARIFQEPDTATISNARKISLIQTTVEAASTAVAFALAAVVTWYTSDGKSGKLRKTIESGLIGSVGGAAGLGAGYFLGHMATGGIPLEKVVQVDHTMEHLVAGLVSLPVLFFFAYLHRHGAEQRNEMYNSNKANLAYTTQTLSRELIPSIQREMMRREKQRQKAAKEAREAMMGNNNMTENTWSSYGY